MKENERVKGEKKKNSKIVTLILSYVVCTIVVQRMD